MPDRNNPYKRSEHKDDGPPSSNPPYKRGPAYLETTTPQERQATPSQHIETASAVRMPTASPKNPAEKAGMHPNTIKTCGGTARMDTSTASPVPSTQPAASSPAAPTAGTRRRRQTRPARPAPPSPHPSPWMETRCATTHRPPTCPAQRRPHPSGAAAYHATGTPTSRRFCQG